MSKILVIGSDIRDVDLWRMLYIRTNVDIHQYQEAFERRDLPRNITNTINEIRNSGRMILLVGTEAQKAFMFPPLLIHPLQVKGCTWRQIPHPDVDREWYTVETNRVLVELLMEQLYEGYKVTQCERSVL